jgi:hypothetical protein
LKVPLHWFSLYSQHRNTGQVRFSNGWFVSGCQMVWFWNG